jgi:hypothetical protein
MFFKALVVAAVLVGAAGPADAKCSPINEGGDTQPCVTYSEARVVFLTMPRNRVQRVVDTDGRIGGRRTLAGALSNTPTRIHAGDTFRTYPVCSEPGADPVNGGFYVEYGPKDRVVATFYE